MPGHNDNVVALTPGETPAVDTTGCCLNLIDAIVDGKGIGLMVCIMMMMLRRMRAAANIGIRGAISLISSNRRMRRKRR